jgi:hypothetical protein
LTLESEIVLCHDRKRPALRPYSARGSGLRSADGRAPPFHMGILTDMGQSV